MSMLFPLLYAHTHKYTFPCHIYTSTHMNPSHNHHQPQKTQRFCVGPDESHTIHKIRTTTVIMEESSEIDEPLKSKIIEPNRPHATTVRVMEVESVSSETFQDGKLEFSDNQTKMTSSGIVQEMFSDNESDHILLKNPTSIARGISINSATDSESNNADFWNREETELVENDLAGKGGQKPVESKIMSERKQSILVDVETVEEGSFWDDINKDKKDIDRDNVFKKPGKGKAVTFEEAVEEAANKSHRIVEDNLDQPKQSKLFDRSEADSNSVDDDLAKTKKRLDVDENKKQPRKSSLYTDEKLEEKTLGDEGKSKLVDQKSVGPKSLRLENGDDDDEYDRKDEGRTLMIIIIISYTHKNSKISTKTQTQLTIQNPREINVLILNV